MILFLNLVSSETTYTASTKTVCDGITCTKTLYSGPVAYLDNGAYVPINTTVVESSDALFDYEVVRGVYSAFFKSNPTSGQAVKFLKDDIEITFQPMALNYRNDLNQLQQLNMIQSVTGLPSDNVFRYDAAYGPGITLLYKCYEDNLKEGLMIDSLSRLPLPGQYILDGGNATLDLDFVMTTNSQHIVIEGSEWDMASTERTSEEVFIKDNNGKILYKLNKPVAYDAAGDSVSLEYEFKKSSSKLYVIIKMPYSWLIDSVFPVEIDPTLSLYDADSENLDDTHVNEESDQDLSTTIYMISSPVANKNKRSYIKFNISALSAEYTVTDAELRLWAYDKGTDYSDAAIGVYLVNVSWSESDTKWSNQPCDAVLNSSKCNLTAIDTATPTSTSPTLGFVTWDVTDSVTSELALSKNNISFMVKHVTEDTNANYFSFRTKEYYDYRPWLLISYTEPTAPYWTAHTNNASSSKYNDTVRWKAEINDDTELGYYRFATNMTGTWLNKTLTFTSGTSVNVTYDLVINATRGTYVCGQFWFSDTSYNVNTTNTSCFTVANTVPVAENVSIVPSPASSAQNLNCTYDYYDVDSDAEGGVNFRWYNNSALYSVTTQVLGSGNTSDGEKWLCSVRVNDTYDFGSWVNASELTINDTVAPLLGNITVPSTATQNVQTTLYADCYDAGSSIEYVKINVTDPDAQKSTYSFTAYSGNTYRLLFTPTKPGNYQFANAICRDTSGNSVTNSSSFTMYVSVVASGGGGGGSSYTRCNWKIYRPANQIINGYGKPGETGSPYDIQVYNNETQTLIFSFRTEGVNCIFNYKDIEVQGSSFGTNQVKCIFPEEKTQTGKIIIEAGGCDSAIDVTLVSNEGGIIFAILTGDVGLLPALAAWIVIITFVVFLVVSLK